MLMPNRNKANINAISITRAMASVAGPTCDCKSGCAPLTLMRLARNGHGSMSDLSSLLWEERKSNFGAVRSVDEPYRKCGGSLLTALSWHLKRPTASAERASTTKHA